MRWWHSDKPLPCMFFVLHCLRPALFWSVSTNTFRSGYGAAEKKIRKHIQYGHARLNQRTLLHVEKSVPEQVTFGL
jgi:hypothetical protein